MAVPLRVTKTGEGMSIMKNGTLKVNCARSFTNKVTMSTEEPLSMPPDGLDCNTWTRHETLEGSYERARRILKDLYGEKSKDWKIDSFRICWSVSLIDRLE